MNRKPESTIKPKPEVPAIEDWIQGGANQNREAASPVSAVQPDSQPASLPSSQHSAGEATAMLSVRIPKGLHHRLRVHAATHEVQIQDLVTRLLTEHLAQSDLQHGVAVQ